MSRHSRRVFLSSSAAATGALALGAYVNAAAANQSKSPNERLRIAGVGTTNRAGADLAELSSQDIVALVDVDDNNMAKGSARYPEAHKYRDFRVMLEKEGDKIDAVMVGTADHTHAPAAAMALRLGKHVYCEKPLTHNVWEARLIREAAAKAKVTTQMGIQIHAGDNYRRVVELIRAQAIGAVSEVHVWVARAWGLQSEEDAKKHEDIVFVQDRPKEVHPVPKELDWDLWLGPAPKRPFNEVYVPGPKWYRWWDFGNGTMSDLGSHWNDLPFWALDLKVALTIKSSGPPPHPEIAPASMQATYEYGPRDTAPAVTLTWYQGMDKPPIWENAGIPQWKSGVLFVGDKGMLLSDYGKHLLLPEKQFEGFQRPAQSIPNSIGHHAEWVNACKTGEPTTCNFEYSGWLTEANHLGNVAYRVGKKLEWDPIAMRCKNVPEADAFLRRKYRSGWKLET
jgi:predicted dehydrogenase